MGMGMPAVASGRVSDRRIASLATATRIVEAWLRSVLVQLW